MGLLLVLKGYNSGALDMNNEASCSADYIGKEKNGG